MGKTYIFKKLIWILNICIELKNGLEYIFQWFFLTLCPASKLGNSAYLPIHFFKDFFSNMFLCCDRIKCQKSAFCEWLSNTLTFEFYTTLITAGFLPSFLFEGWWINVRQWVFLALKFATVEIWRPATQPKFRKLNNVIHFERYQRTAFT